MHDERVSVPFIYVLEYHVPIHMKNYDYAYAKCMHNTTIERNRKEADPAIQYSPNQAISHYDTKGNTVR